MLIDTVLESISHNADDSIEVFGFPEDLVADGPDGPAFGIDTDATAGNAELYMELTLRGRSVDIDAVRSELVYESIPLDREDLHKLPSPLLSRKEAAAYLGVAEQTLAIWKSAGRYNLPVIKIGRLAKYRLTDLDAFIAGGLQSK